jgi:hypothetical protein
MRVRGHGCPWFEQDFYTHSFFHLYRILERIIDTKTV